MTEFKEIILLDHIQSMVFRSHNYNIIIHWVFTKVLDTKIINKIAKRLEKLIIYDIGECT